MIVIIGMKRIFIFMKVVYCLYSFLIWGYIRINRLMKKNYIDINKIEFNINNIYNVIKWVILILVLKYIKN